MKIAYAVLLHHKERQFEWLFNAIYDPGDVFVIHIDKKSPGPTWRRMTSLVGNKPNVHFLRRRRVAWGGWNLAAVTLASIRLLLDRDKEWAYFINLSGQDYPLRPPDEIRGELARSPGLNYIESREIEYFPPEDRMDLRWRLRKRRVEVRGRVFHTPIPHRGRRDVRIDWKGSNWHALSREFCEWIFSDPLARHCVAAVRGTYIPEEFLMPTLAMNGPFAGTVTFDDRRESDWVPGRSHPETLTMRHLDLLVRSQGFFARKFDETVDAEILGALARRIGAPPVD